MKSKPKLVLLALLFLVPMFFRIRFALLFLLLIDTVAGCAIPPRPVSIPTIQQTAGWHMEQRCGYEGCYPLVDALIGKGIEVRVEAENGKIDKNIFTIKVEFMTPERVLYQYTPSLSSVILSDGRSIKSKDFPCSNTAYSSSVFKSDSNLKVPLPLRGWVHKGQRHVCFLHYFDTLPPSTEEPFILKLGGLETAEGSINFPDLHFSGGMRR